MLEDPNETKHPSSPPTTDATSSAADAAHISACESDKGLETLVTTLILNHTQSEP